MKSSVEYLSLTSNRLRSTNCGYSWESAAMAVKFLLIGGEDLQETLHNRLSDGQATEINYNFGSAKSGLFNRTPQLKKQSGRYEPKSAIPI